MSTNNLSVSVLCICCLYWAFHCTSCTRAQNRAYIGRFGCFLNSHRAQLQNAVRDKINRLLTQ